MRLLSLLKNTWYTFWYEKAALRPRTVLLESRNGDGLGSNLLRVAMELEKPEFARYTCYLACTKAAAPQVKALLKRYHVKRAALVESGSLKYFRLLATAGVLFTDTSFPRRFVKKKGQVVVNTWHGTPFKKFGGDVPAGVYAMGNVQRSFLMADYIVCSSRFSRQIFGSAQNLDNLYQGTYLYTGQARNQVFFEKETAQRVRKELGLETKRVYCYLPTWRGVEKPAASAKDKSPEVERIQAILKELDGLLWENETLYVQLHPFVRQGLSFENFTHIQPTPEDRDVYELLAAADGLVTDYSSVFYDYANKKDGKIVFFPFDQAEFAETRDCYLSYSELPFPTVDSAKALVRELRSPRTCQDDGFREQFCTYDGRLAAQRLCRTVLLGKASKGTVTERAEGNGKKNLLFYVGGLAENGITSAFLNLMKNADREHYNYFAAFQTEYLKKEPLRAGRLPEFVQAAPMSSGWFLTVGEAAAAQLFYRFNRSNPWIRKKLRGFYAREYARNFGWARLDWCIHYTGYERKVTGLFQEAPCKRGIFAHSDMVREIRGKGNQHAKALGEAYANYDMTAAAGVSAYKSVLALGGSPSRLVLVENCHDDAGTLQKAGEALAFDSFTVSNHSLTELKAALEKDGRKLITIGRFSAEKGHGMLLEAFARYHRAFPASLLIIIGGGGELYEETKKKAKALGLGACVFLIRSMTNPMPVLKACDLFLLSSFYEALGLALLEADTLGLPVVSTDIPGPGDFVRTHGGCVVSADAKGLYEGMMAYERGEIPVMRVDYREHNRRAAQEFYDALER